MTHALTVRVWVSGGCAVARLYGIFMAHCWTMLFVLCDLSRRNGVGVDSLFPVYALKFAVAWFRIGKY